MQTHSWADTCSAKVNQGICLCSKESLPTPDDFIRCWVHECQRVFQAPAAEGRLECMMVQTTGIQEGQTKTPDPESCYNFPRSVVQSMQLRKQVPGVLGAASS